MKLLRYGVPGAEKPGLLDAEGTIRDLSGVIAEIDGSVLSSEAGRSFWPLGHSHYSTMR